MLDVSSIGSAAPATGSSGLGGSRGPTTEQFLVLLLTQLQNQDPLNPVDDREFTAQLAQLSSLERLGEIRQSLVAIGGLQESLVNAQALDLLGRTAIVSGVDSVRLASGNAEPILVDVPDGAASAQVTIQDASGRTVRTLSVPAGKGRHEVTWDGKDDAGNALSDGAYKVTATATAAAGGDVPVSLLLSIVVDGVSFGDNGIQIVSRGRDITFDQIREIRTN